MAQITRVQVINWDGLPIVYVRRGGEERKYQPGDGLLIHLSRLIMTGQVYNVWDVWPFVGSGVGWTAGRRPLDKSHIL